MGSLCFAKDFSGQLLKSFPELSRQEMIDCKCGFKIPSSQSLDVLVHLATMFKISLSHLRLWGTLNSGFGHLNWLTTGPQICSARSGPKLTNNWLTLSNHIRFFSVIGNKSKCAHYLGFYSHRMRLIYIIQSINHSVILDLPAFGENFKKICCNFVKGINNWNW